MRDRLQDSLKPKVFFGDKPRKQLPRVCLNVTVRFVCNVSENRAQSPFDTPDSARIPEIADTHVISTVRYPDSLTSALYNFHKPTDYTLEEFREVVYNLPAEDVRELHSMMVQEDIALPLSDTVVNVEDQPHEGLTDVREANQGASQDVNGPAFSSRMSSSGAHSGRSTSRISKTRVKQVHNKEKASAPRPVTRLSPMAISSHKDRIQSFSHRHQFFAQASVSQTDTQLGRFLSDVRTHALELGLRDVIAEECVEKAKEEYRVIREWLSLQDGIPNMPNQPTTAVTGIERSAEGIEASSSDSKSDHQIPNALSVAGINCKRKRNREHDCGTPSQHKDGDESPPSASGDDDYEADSWTAADAGNEDSGSPEPEILSMPQTNPSKKQQKRKRRKVEKSVDDNEMDQAISVPAPDQDRPALKESSDTAPSGKRKRRRDRRRSKIQLSRNTSLDVTDVHPASNSLSLTGDSKHPQNSTSSCSGAHSHQTAPDPVIHMLAVRASTSPELEAVLKTIATGEATPEQLEYYQRQIDELKEIDPRKVRKNLEAVYQHRAALAQPENNIPSRKRKGRNRRRGKMRKPPEEKPEPNSGPLLPLRGSTVLSEMVTRGSEPPSQALSTFGEPVADTTQQIDHKESGPAGPHNEDASEIPLWDTNGLDAADLPSSTPVGNRLVLGRQPSVTRSPSAVEGFYDPMIRQARPAMRVRRTMIST